MNLIDVHTIYTRKRQNKYTNACACVQTIKRSLHADIYRPNTECRYLIIHLQVSNHFLFTFLFIELFRPTYLCTY